MPDSAPAPAPAPIVLPEFKPQPVAQPAAELVAATPDPVAAAPVATPTSTRSAPRKATRSAEPVAAAPVAVQAATPATTSAPPADAAPITQLASPEPIASADPAVEPAKASTNDNTAEVGLGLLGLAALGGLGAYAASRRRRRVVSDEGDAAVAPRAAVVPPVAKLAHTAWVPAVTTAASTPAPFMFERKPEAAPTTGRVRSADIIPAGPLPTSLAMADLFERMVNAAPDKDNPFKSDKRRRARVRWLLKQHEYRLADPEGLTAADRFNAGESGFDFRTYKPSSTSLIDEEASKEVIHV